MKGDMLMDEKEMDRMVPSDITADIHDRRELTKDIY